MGKAKFFLVIFHSFCMYLVANGNNSVITPIKCQDTFHDLKGHRKVRCPANCQLAYYHVLGTTNYGLFSNICAAGIHDGVITTSGGEMKVILVPGFKNLMGSVENGIKSRERSQTHASFILEALSPATQSSSTSSETTITTATTIPTTTTTAKTTTPTTITTTTPQTTTTTAPQTTTTLPTVTTTTIAHTTTELPTTTKSSSTTTKSLKNATQISTEIKKMATTFQSTRENVKIILTPRERVKQPVDILMNSTSNPKDFTEPNHDIEFTEQFLISKKVWIIVGTVATIIVLGIFLVILLKKRRRVCNKRRSGCRNRSTAEGIDSCVCYVAVDSSNQALLFDPETCERPCSRKELVQAEVNEVCEHSGAQCESCSGEMCSSKYAF